MIKKSKTKKPFTKYYSKWRKKWVAFSGPQRIEELKKYGYKLK